MGFNHNMQAEYPVNGMPNKSGKGFVDYILRGNNGKIIGLVEAKSTIKNQKLVDIKLHYMQMLSNENKD